MKKHLFGLFNFESNACLFYITGYPLQIFKKKFLLNNSVMLYFMMFDYMLASVLSRDNGHSICLQMCSFANFADIVFKEI